MIRISVPWIIDVAQALDGLDSVEAGQTAADAWFSLFNALQNLDLIFQQSVYNQHIRVSRQKASELRSNLERLLHQDETYQITDVDMWLVRNNRNRFKEVFLAEVSSMPAYLVGRKESYDIDILVDAGIALFPPSLLQKAPETERDAMQAGRALAFEVATGCGFHVFRITEAVVKRYWDEVSGGRKRPRLQTLGNYAAEMEKASFGDEKVVESIKQMTRLHRNPIIHPDVILTVEEAIGVVGMARSVIGAMLAVLPDVPLTTGAPTSAQSA